jgi:hypothetical protein
LPVDETAMPPAWAALFALVLSPTLPAAAVCDVLRFASLPV